MDPLPTLNTPGVLAQRCCNAVQAAHGQPDPIYKEEGSLWNVRGQPSEEECEECQKANNQEYESRLYLMMGLLNEQWLRGWHVLALAVVEGRLDYEQIGL